MRLKCSSNYKTDQMFFLVRAILAQSSQKLNWLMHPPTRNTKHFEPMGVVSIPGTLDVSAGDRAGMRFVFQRNPQECLPLEGSR